MLKRVLAAGVIAAVWAAVHLVEWLDSGEYDEEAEEADWPEPPDIGDDD